ncbi:MAG: protein kinase domain-containing protein, partial [Planctomycetaceae bacterium]
MSDGELTIDGYQLVNCIHTGNSSQVWEVREQVGSRQLAMKLLLPEAMSDSDQVKTLKHEARVTKSLEHPNIVKFHKLVTNKKSAYMIMDYFRAPNVKQQIMTDMLGLHVRFRKLLEQTCLALGYLHEKGWLQRDV